MIRGRSSSRRNRFTRGRLSCAAVLVLILGLLYAVNGHPTVLLLGESPKAPLWIAGYYVDNTFNVRDIPWSKLTHAIQTSLIPADGQGRITGIPDAHADAFTSAAHAAGVKAIVGVGGDAKVSASISNNLDGFVGNLVKFIGKHKYDGIDLDWESGKYSTEPDQSNYINFINALRNALGPDKVISIAVYWGNGMETVVHRTSSKLDQVNIMCYDMDQSLTYTHYNHGMYRLKGETQGASAAEGAHFAGYVPAAKIGLGIPFYGRVWSGCGDQACKDGLHEPMQTWFGTPKTSTIYYKDLIASPYWSHPQRWDAVRGGSYISIDEPGASNDRFISFTGDRQIKSIVRLAKDQGYGGVMEFALDYDFVASQTGDARHPLATATYEAVAGLQDRQ